MERPPASEDSQVLTPRRNGTEYITQPHFVLGTLPLRLDHYEDGPATLFAGCSERFYHFRYLHRHQVLRLLTQRSFWTCRIAASAILQQPYSGHGPLLFHLWVTVPLKCCTSNRSAPKCSRMAFQRDKRGTSTTDSPPIPTLTPTTTTTCLTATSKMNPHVPNAKAKNPSETHRTQRHSILLPQILNPQSRQVRPRMITGQSLLLLNVSPFLVIPIADRSTIPQEWVKLLSSRIWEL